jgi:hypothetical protein
VGLALSGTAHAGPIELFSQTSIDPANPMQLVIPYRYGGGGMFISADGGSKYGLLCTSAINPAVVHDDVQVYTSAKGDIYIGVFDGLFKGDKNGCNFTAVPELSTAPNKHYIAAVTGDPIDQNRIYAVTTDASPAKNGLYMTDGTGPFMPFGTAEELFVNTLHVVKNGTGRRFYVTGVKSDVMTNKVTYTVRVSDDDAKTWTSNEVAIDTYGPMDMYADFNIVAIDPTNPDHVLARIARDQDIDTLLYSPMQGKAGTWTVVAEVKDLAAVAFTPEGKLYFGDNDQSSPAIFSIDKLGDAPKMLDGKWKVGCLQYDAANKRMFGCNDFRFGTVDMTTGLFNITLDMRCAQSFVECPGSAATMHDMCQAQLLNAYCGQSHYPAAPLCKGYDQGEGADQFIASLDFTCQDGKVVVKPDDDELAMSSSAGTGAAGASAASSGAAGASSTASGVSTAGVSASQPSAAAGTGATTASTAESAAPPPTKSGGCSVSEPGAGTSFGALLSACGVLCVGLRLRSRGRRSAASPQG